MKFIICDHKSGYTVTDGLIRALNFSKLLYKYHFYKKKLNKFLFTKNIKYENYSKNIIDDIVFKKIFFIFWDNHEKNENKNVVIIRNPKDIIISGYLYHLKCREFWCCNKNINYYHGYKDWYLSEEILRQNNSIIQFAKKFSENICYQNKLKSLNILEGIKFEMNNVAQLTLDGMKKILKKKNIKIVKFEDLIFDTDKTIKSICDYLKYNQLQTILTIFYFKNLKTFKNKKYFNLQKEKNLVNNFQLKRNFYTDKYWNSDLIKFYDKKFNDLDILLSKYY